MKFKTSASSSRRKQRKAALSADSLTTRRLMSVRLSKDLSSKHKGRSRPIRKGDEVKILRAGTVRFIPCRRGAV